MVSESPKVNLLTTNVGLSFFLVFQMLCLIDVLPYNETYMPNGDKIFSTIVLILSIVFIILTVIVFLYWYKTKKSLGIDKIEKVLGLLFVFLTIPNFILAIIIIVR